MVPEFPGQSHVFFWREYQALGAIGVESKLISTRHPHKSIRSHSWSDYAQNMTYYLYPLSLADLARTIALVLAAGPGAWGRCARAVVKARMPLLAKWRLMRLMPFGAKLVALARHEGLSHIHVGMCSDVANVAMFARLLGGPAYSLSLLGPRLDTYGPNQDQKWKHASFGLFQSRQLFEEAQARIGSYLPEKIAIAPVGVDVDVMRRETLYTPWPNEGPCRIYCCARLNRVKGHIYLIDAVRLLRGEWNIDAHLVLAGEDEAGGQGYRKDIEAFVVAAGLADHVTFLGAVSEEENRRQYEAAHIYAMASLDEAAGAVAAMEAMAMELPVVMTDSGATRELLDHEVDGLIVPIRNARALAREMHWVLRDPALARRLGQAGREKIVTQFNHWRSARKIREFLDN